MILRLTWKAKKVYHVPKALYYWRSHKASVAQDINAKTYAVDAAKRAVHDFIMASAATRRTMRDFLHFFESRFEIREGFRLMYGFFHIEERNVFALANDIILHISLHTGHSCCKRSAPAIINCSKGGVCDPSLKYC